ncbi:MULTISPECIES: hypothetical protein [Pseudomonas]|uniref:hypothetical protein n=1 Tax=Pseudomonas sp. BF-R-19 TaxID=2832397 RepID=UPI001CC047D6|nr:hypothetical protein [Pseudomonas sp. BF-R-19]
MVKGNHSRRWSDRRRKRFAALPTGALLRMALYKSACTSVMPSAWRKRVAFVMLTPMSRHLPFGDKHQERAYTEMKND